MKSSSFRSLSKRYAKALFGYAVETRSQDRVLNDIRALKPVLSGDPDVADFFRSPVVPVATKQSVLEKAIEGKSVSNEVQQFLRLLAQKDRLAIFGDVVEAFQAEIDSANNVSRGTVRSTTALSPTERSQVETTVERVLKKKVIMTYKVDPSVIGGLVAQAGSYTFDDSVSTHLKRMTEELKGRAL